MHLTFYTDYALRLLMLVGLDTEHLATTQEVTDRFGISKNHLMKVASQLGQAIMRRGTNHRTFGGDNLR
jgi:Rrf2 family transcriptional regulator, nitric oxide-sensitive transcriptional repressor